MYRSATHRVALSLAMILGVTGCTGRRSSHQSGLPAAAPVADARAADRSPRLAAGSHHATLENTRSLIERESEAMGRARSRLDSLRAERRALEVAVAGLESGKVGRRGGGGDRVAHATRPSERAGGRGAASLTGPQRTLIATRVFFATNSARLTERTKRELVEKAEILRAHPELAMVLIGHADARGGEEYNQRLSEQRAEAARRFLITRGIDEHRVFAEGRGKREPAMRGRGSAAWRVNRRVEFQVE
jgi:outer membrane protein OmpA-like peptidoglycan-associated protein